MKENLNLKKHENASFKARRLNLKSFKGITLVALVVTIVVLLILAGITITVLFSDNGVIKTAQDAAEKNRKAEARSKLDLAMADWQVVKRTENKTFENHLKEAFGDANVTPNGDSFNVKIDGYTFTVKDDGTITVANGTGGEVEDNRGQEFAYLFEVNDGVLSVKTSSTYYEKGIGSYIKDLDGNKIQDIIIPNKIGEEKVEKIAQFAFNDIKLNSVEITNGISIIEPHAFDCCGLKEVKIPNSVKEIREYGFASNSFEELILPDSLEVLGKCAFYQCFELVEVTIPERVSRIERYCFGDCSSLVRVNLPDGLSSIGEGAFSECESLTKIFIPKAVQWIVGGNMYNERDRAFYRCPRGMTIYCEADAEQPDWGERWYDGCHVEYGCTREQFEALDI